MGIYYLTKITNKQQNMNFFNTRLPSFNLFDNFAQVRRQNTKCCNDPNCENNYAKNNVRKAQPQRREPFDIIYNEENDAKYPNRNVRTARKTRNAPENAKNNCYEPKENLKRKAFVADENQENIDPNFSQNEPKPTPKSYSTSFQNNKVNKNGKKTTIARKKFRENDNSETSIITKITEDKDGNRRVQKIKPENYSDELLAVMNSMEENGAILMEIPSDDNKSDNGSVKMLEENNNSKRSFSKNKFSNTKSGNNLF